MQAIVDLHPFRANVALPPTFAQLLEHAHAAKVRNPGRLYLPRSANFQIVTCLPSQGKQGTPSKPPKLEHPACHCPRPHRPRLQWAGVLPRRAHDFQDPLALAARKPGRAGPPFEDHTKENDVTLLQMKIVQMVCKAIRRPPLFSALSPTA